MFKQFLAMALCFSLYPVLVFGQQAGTVTGRVINDTGRVLPGASVSLETDTDQLFVVTDENGQFRLDNVPTGPAELIVRLINFSTFRSEVQVISNDTVTVNLSLTLGMTADVVVTGSRTFRNIAWSWRSGRWVTHYLTAAPRAGSRCCSAAGGRNVPAGV